MKTQHTPTPWKLIKNQWSDGDIEANAEFAIVAQPHPMKHKLITKSIVDGEGEINKANAELIVKAVNSHYELLEVLKGTLNELDEFADHWKNEADSFDHPAQEQERGMCLRREQDVRGQIERIKQAIQNAE
jgi:hypothetical protein